MDVAKDQRSKLDSKSKPCIFMGYSEDEFGYRLWDLVDKKVVRSRDIVFMEDKTIEDWKQQESKHISQPTPTTIPVDHKGEHRLHMPVNTSSWLMKVSQSAMMKPLPTSTKRNGWAQCKMRWTPCMRITPTTWLSYQKVREHSGINGSTRWRLEKSTTHPDIKPLLW